MCTAPINISWKSISLSRKSGKKLGNFVSRAQEILIYNEGNAKYFLKNCKYINDQYQIGVLAPFVGNVEKWLEEVTLRDKRSKHR